MGKKSTKENKNIYHQKREAIGYTRDKASEEMGVISSDRIEKIENGRSLPHPDEVLYLAECYKSPELCNYYCSHECPIGKVHVPEVKMKNLSQIVLEVLASLNSIEKERQRLIEITVDEQISEDEVEDFVAIQEKLNSISLTVDSLKLWVEKTIIDGKLDHSVLDTIRK